jgi:hypothetical protein
MLIVGQSIIKELNRIELSWKNGSTYPFNEYVCLVQLVFLAVVHGCIFNLKTCVSRRPSRETAFFFFFFCSSRITPRLGTNSMLHIKYCNYLSIGKIYSPLPAFESRPIQYRYCVFIPLPPIQLCSPVHLQHVTDRECSSLLSDSTPRAFQKNK